MKALIVNKLIYKYPNGRLALTGANLEIEKGMKVALIGKNGSGKTTFMLHLCGLLDGDGHIEVMGIKRTKKSIRKIREMVALLFSQVEYQFIMPNLLNDVILSVQTHVNELTKTKHFAMEWLKHFGLVEYADTNPLDLSSGEMKRAALAGVLAKEPEILLMDEPLNNLDKENSAILIKHLKEINTTMLMATHKDYLVRELASHVVIMEDGKLSPLYIKEEALSMGAVKDLLF